MNTVEAYLIAGGILLILSVLASKATGRLGVPSLIVFLAVGMLAGSEGIGGFYFDNAPVAQTLGVIALIYILFAGGLETEWSSIRPVLSHGALLATIGVFLTCILTGLFTAWVTDFTLVEGLLLGAIVSSTDAAAVFAVLRTKSVSLKGRIKPLLELESGSNDPMAVFLTVGLIGLLKDQSSSPLGLVPMFMQQMAVGALAGVLAGKLIVQILNRIRLEFEGLYPVMSLALVMLTYGTTQAIGGNGFLAVYLTGLMLSQNNFIHKKSLILFHNGVAWLMQITMFLALGLLAFPSQLTHIAGIGLLISGFLIFISRPISVFSTLIRSPFGLRERTMIAWVGLRGSVPIILATYPLMAGVPKAEVIFNLVFFIVLTSVLIQGTSIPVVARWLGVDAPIAPKFRYPLEYVPTATNLKSDLVEVEVPTRSAAAGKSVLELNLPKGALIILVQRRGDVLVPRGSTELLEGDKLLVLADRDDLKKVRDIVNQKVGEIA